MYSIYQETMLE